MVVVLSCHSCCRRARMYHYYDDSFYCKISILQNAMSMYSVVFIFVKFVLKMLQSYYAFHFKHAYQRLSNDLKCRLRRRAIKKYTCRHSKTKTISSLNLMIHTKPQNTHTWTHCCQNCLTHVFNTSSEWCALVYEMDMTEQRSVRSRSVATHHHSTRPHRPTPSNRRRDGNVQIITNLKSLGR